jgi:hypothetical protein
MARMKRTLLLLAVLAAVAAALPVTASASTPCRTKIYTDWRQDGKIASAYPLGCYRDALKHVPVDAAVYSSLSADIKEALQAAIARQHGKKVPLQVGKGFEPLADHAVLAAAHAAPHDPSLHRSAVGTVAHDAGSAPLPILVLGGLALALVAAGAIGAGVRHARNRRGL